jgi:hypothetical protein
LVRRRGLRGFRAQSLVRLGQASSSGRLRVVSRRLGQVPAQGSAAAGRRDGEMWAAVLIPAGGVPGRASTKMGADPPALLGRGPLGQHRPRPDRDRLLGPGLDRARRLDTAPHPFPPGHHHQTAAHWVDPAPRPCGEHGAGLWVPQATQPTAVAVVWTASRHSSSTAPRTALPVPVRRSRPARSGVASVPRRRGLGCTRGGRRRWGRPTGGPLVIVDAAAARTVASTGRTGRGAGQGCSLPQVSAASRPAGISRGLAQP